MSSIFSSTRKTQKLKRMGALKGETLSDFLTSIVAKHQKIEGGPFGNFFPKSHNTEKLKRGPFRTPLGFFNILSVAKHFVHHNMVLCVQFQ